VINMTSARTGWGWLPSSWPCGLGNSCCGRYMPMLSGSTVATFCGRQQHRHVALGDSVAGPASSAIAVSHLAAQHMRAPHPAGCHLPGCCAGCCGSKRHAARGTMCTCCNSVTSVGFSVGTQNTSIRQTMTQQQPAGLKHGCFAQRCLAWLDSSWHNLNLLATFQPVM
jgi:hypothetical protein